MKSAGIVRRLRSSRRGDALVIKSWKLDGSEDPGTTGAHGERGAIGGGMREHVVLEVEAIDRMYLNVYLPHLQSERTVPPPNSPSERIKFLLHPHVVSCKDSRVLIRFVSKSNGLSEYSDRLMEVYR
jgi:hypothetical protein